MLISAIHPVFRTCTHVSHGETRRWSRREHVALLPRQLEPDSVPFCNLRYDKPVDELVFTERKHGSEDIVSYYQFVFTPLLMVVSLMTIVMMTWCLETPHQKEGRDALPWATPSWRLWPADSIG